MERVVLAKIQIPNQRVYTMFRVDKMHFHRQEKSFWVFCTIKNNNTYLAFSKKIILYPLYGIFC